MKKKLIVNADDFGQSPGVNEGIIRAFEKGIVTSASLMVRYPAAIEASQYAKQNNFSIGLHADLGEWKCENGYWYPVYEVVPTNDVEAVRNELQNQLNIFLNIHGKKPTHIDSHQHIHKDMELQNIFIELAASQNIPLRHFTKNVKYCGAFYGQNSDSSPNHDSISIRNLVNIIKTLPEGTSELACHPGLKIEFETMYKIEREIEVESLCAQTVEQEILLNHIHLCSFNDVNL